jgi:hypothetical protein
MGAGGFVQMCCGIEMGVNHRPGTKTVSSRRQKLEKASLSAPRIRLPSPPIVGMDFLVYSPVIVFIGRWRGGNNDADGRTGKYLVNAGEVLGRCRYNFP